MDTIYMDVLVVGHTHSTIDQYFSVLASRINSTHFIGSPMALWDLFEQLEGRLKPKINRKIEVCLLFYTNNDPH